MFLREDDDSRIKKIIKDTEFFEPSKYLPFEKDIVNGRFKIKPQNINEINVKCYGYGYFEEGKTLLKTQLKQNLLAYLRAVTRECKNVKTLKLEFCGFDVEDKSLLKIIEIVEELLRGKTPKETIWVHTRFLKQCEPSTVQEMLNLTDQLVKSNYEEISVMMAGWEFKKDPISYGQLEDIFGTFGKNLAPMPRSPLKRVKLDISSCFNLLAKSLPYTVVAEGIETARTQNIKKSRMKQMNSDQARKMIMAYLTNLDQKYKNDNPIPGKGPRFIVEDKEYERRKLEYISTLMQKGISRDDLKRVYKESGMSEQHKSTLRKIEKEVHEEYKQQEVRMAREEELTAQTNNYEKEISAKFIKFPFDYIMAERRKAFHRLIIAFVGDVQGNLQQVQQFQLDMRNWNGLFQMGDLKKLLDKEFAQMGAMKLIGNAFSQVIANIGGNQEEEEAAKLKLSFLM